MTNLALAAIPALGLLQDAEPQMTTAGWVFMGLGWLFVSCLAVWCFKRVLGGGPEA